MKTATQQKITALFMGKTDKTTGSWFPIQKMTWTFNNDEYLDCTIAFINGAKKLEQLHPQKPNAVSFGSLDRVVKYKDITSCPWSNRMPVNREPNSDLIKFLGFNKSSNLDPVKYVARSGGYRHGDLKDIFPQVREDATGKYNFIFRNVDSYCLSTKNRPELNELETEEKVIPVPIDQRLQLMCRSHMIGFAPPYIKELYKKYGEHLEIAIYQVNQQAPFNYQFMLQATLDKKIGIPFSEPEYQPV